MDFLKVSDNGHYFTRGGEPFFWLGGTIWPAHCEFNTEELEFYFKKHHELGFTVEHIMLAFENWDGTSVEIRPKDMTIYDPPLWLDNNPATPNEAFFKRVDEVIRIAAKYEILIVILACGGAWGTFVDYRKVITKENAGAYGKWLGERYRDEPNIVWSNGFDLPPWWYEDIAQEFAAGLTEGDRGKHLQFYHPCGCMSSNHFHQEKWLSGNFIQTWAFHENIHRMVIADYHRRPYKPVVHVEGSYEADHSYPTSPISSHRIRNQAYWAYLSGGFHTYGHGDIYRREPYWRDTLDSYGGRHMKVLKDFFTSLEWWKLVPDQSLFMIGEQVNHVAARTMDNSLAVIYFGFRAVLPVNVGRIGNGKPVRVTWIDPQNGNRMDGGILRGELVYRFTSHSACDDALLLLTAEE